MATTKKINISIEDLNTKLALIEMSIPANVNDHLTYLVKKLFKKATEVTKPLTEKFNEDLQDLQVKNASTDDKGVLQMDGDKYKFTSEKQAILNAEARKLRKELNQQIVEIEVTFADEDCLRVKNLDLFIKDELAGILFEN